MMEEPDNPLPLPEARITRREGLELAAASLMASLVPIPALSGTQSASATQTGENMTDTPAIRPFQVSFPEADLADLKARVSATKWPDRETVTDASQGVQLATIQAARAHWATDYDWRRCEAQLNALPQFITEIDGLDIHFIHVRSEHENALPIIITHGWPGSIIEQLKIIEPLTNPTAHGGSASDAFHLVIPSLPGYGFSGKPTAPGWTPSRIAQAWATLMQRLGYTRYVAQGGDWGNAVSEIMALQQPPGLLGIHTNMAATVPPNISKALAFREAPPADLDAGGAQRVGPAGDFYSNGLAYALEMNNRPQTLYGIADSPVGLAAWMIDHDIRSYLMIARVLRRAARRPDAGRRSRQRHALLADEHGGLFGAPLLGHQPDLDGSGFFDVRGVQIPVAVSAFPDEIYAAPQELGRAGVSQAHPLQPARQGRALRRLGAAGAVHRRDARELPVASLIQEPEQSADRVFRNVTMADHRCRHDPVPGREPIGKPHTTYGIAARRAVSRLGLDLRSPTSAASSTTCGRRSADDVAIQAFREGALPFPDSLRSSPGWLAPGHARRGTTALLSRHARKERFRRKRRDKLDAERVDRHRRQGANSWRDA